MADPAANIGRRLENAVYLQLRNCEDVKEIFYYKEAKEVDFLYQRGSHTSCVNVAYRIYSADTARRELSGLEDARRVFPNAECSLILNDWDPTLFTENVTIAPAWKFLIQ